jgi:hypothetical protein
MSSLYTKNGIPLRVSGDAIFGPTGRQVGRVRGSKVHAPDGRYFGTIVGDRLVYRSTDSATISSPFAPRAASPSASARTARSAIWGDEPSLG